MTEVRKTDFDVVIVGGGVIGLACGWTAARRGLNVAVVDRGEPGGGTTRVAAGMLAPVGELTFGERDLLEMTLTSAAAFSVFAAELEAASGHPVEYRRCGGLHVALDRDEAAELRRRHELQIEMELESEWLAPRGCRGLESALSPSLAGGFHAAGDTVVDPRLLAAALVAGLVEAGASIFPQTEVRGLIDEAGTARGVIVHPTGTRGVSSPGFTSPPSGLPEPGEIRAANVVIAAGCWSGSMEWLPAPRPAVRPVKGQVVTVSGEGGAPINGIVASERVYLVPRPDGRVVIGATVEEQGFDTSVTAGGVHELLREAYRLVPEIAEMEMVETLAGLRPGTPDNLPLIGPTEMDGLIYATGHYRNGVLLAPLTAEAVAATLAGETIGGPAALSDPRRAKVLAPG